MNEYARENSIFSLCGLNCGLCPRYHTEGVSKCPGCGGLNFYEKHPACGIISCSIKHDKVDFCFKCASFPCQKYKAFSEKDSFITYRNVISDLKKASINLDKYLDELKEKMEILEFFLNSFNDGRRKNFYCLATNLLELDDLKQIVNKTIIEINCQTITQKEKIEQIVALFYAKAKERDVVLKLSK
jgi:hypothetical protein